MTMNLDHPRVPADAIGAHYGVTAATVLRWARKGVIPCLYIDANGRARFDPVAVEAALQARPRRPREATGRYAKATATPAN
jgi:predicted site-specific integrase-resolvase